MTKLKIAASTYLNSAPLVYSFLRGELKNECEFLGDAAPAYCADLLKQGLVNIALIPVIEYQSMSSISQICLIPDIAVAAKDFVKSVILVTKCPIQEIRTVSLDTSSRTSAALVKIILEKFYQINPTYISAKPNLLEMFKNSDAALIIGDPAIKIRKDFSNDYQIYDLAQEWKKFTSLPFVFACWGVNLSLFDNQISLLPIDLLPSELFLNKDSLKKEIFSPKRINSIFIQAKKEGLKMLEVIVKEYSKDLEIDEAVLLDYLEKNVNYDLDKENLLGLERFYQLAFECNLIKEKHPIRFFEQ
jgi:chorismate dehydratase